MDTATAFAGLDWIAVIAAAVAAFVAGAIWFGPLFGKAWIAGFGFDEAELSDRNQAKIFGLTLVLNHRYGDQSGDVFRRRALSRFRFGGGLCHRAWFRGTTDWRLLFV